MSVTEACESPDALSSLDSLGDAVIVTGLSGTVQFLNLAGKKLVATGDQPVAGRPLNEVVRLEEESTGRRIDNLVEFAIVSGCSVSLGRDLVLVLGSGRTIPVEGEVSARRIEGRAAGAVVTLRDITSRTREDLLRRERQQMRAIGQLAGSVAHEVNNLLTVVVGHSEILERRQLAAPSGANVAAIRQAADECVGYPQLLSLSGKEVLLPTIVNLNTMVGALEGDLRSALPAGSTLALSLADSLATVLIDQWKMEQAIADLVRFAAGRTAAGGMVTISTRNMVAETHSRERHSRPFVELTVEDQGPPIRSVAAEELFEPSVSTTPGRPFTLGLFTVRNLVSASGGHLWLESAAATGARIVLSLPQFQDESAAPADSAAPPPPTILLVEDDDAIRILLSNSLEAKGYRVLEARDGEEALVQAQLCDDPIQLLITDVVMPRMDGPALARRLAEMRPATKVLLISGCATDLAAIQELLDGGAHYLQKPFTQSALLEWIETNV